MCNQGPQGFEMDCDFTFEAFVVCRSKLSSKGSGLKYFLFAGVEVKGISEFTYYL